MHTMVVSDPISTTRTWGVYQGPRRLSAPEFLLLAEQTERHQQLVTDIHLAERKSKRWFRVAGVGAAGIITGMVGMAVADEMEPYLLWNRVTFGSSTVAVAGLLGASFPSAKANKLQRDPSASFPIEQAHQWTNGHNEELRVELGLSPEEVWLLELGTEGR